MVPAVALRAEVLRVADRLVLAPAWQHLAEAVGDFWSLIFPTACVRCGAWDQSLCRVCLDDFRRCTVRPFRAEAGAESLPGYLEPRSVRRPPNSSGTDELQEFVPLPVTAAGVYAGSVAGAVLAFKNHGHTDLERPLAAALAGALHAACTGAGGQPAACDYLLVPVPGRSASIRRRGYDPLRLLLQGLVKRGELPAGARVRAAVRPGSAWPAAENRPLPAKAALWATAFVRRSGAGGQKGLGRRSRQRRLAGSMVVTPAARAGLEGRTCLVIDDVLTTGSTVAEVTRALRAAGAEVVGAVVIAATRPPAATKQTPSARLNKSGKSGMNKEPG